jgi:hypothetical protein
MTQIPANVTNLPESVNTLHSFSQNASSALEQAKHLAEPTPLGKAVFKQFNDIFNPMHMADKTTNAEVWYKNASSALEQAKHLAEPTPLGKAVFKQFNDTFNPMHVVDQTTNADVWQKTLTEQINHSFQWLRDTGTLHTLQQNAGNALRQSNQTAGQNAFQSLNDATHFVDPVKTAAAPHIETVKNLVTPHTDNMLDTTKNLVTPHADNLLHTAGQWLATHGHTLGVGGAIGAGAVGLLGLGAYVGNQTARNTINASAQQAAKAAEPVVKTALKKGVKTVA